MCVKISKMKSNGKGGGGGAVIYITSHEHSVLTTQ